MEFGRYKKYESTHKTSGLKTYYFKHTAYASCFVAPGLIFLSIGFPTVTHCISRLVKRSNISLAVLMFPYEIRLSRQWHQGCVLCRRQGKLMDGPQGRGFSLTCCEQKGGNNWSAQVRKDRPASVSVKTSAGSRSAWGKESKSDFLFTCQINFRLADCLNWSAIISSARFNSLIQSRWIPS